MGGMCRQPSRDQSFSAGFGRCGDLDTVLLAAAVDACATVSGMWPLQLAPNKIA